MQPSADTFHENNTPAGSVSTDGKPTDSSLRGWLADSGSLFAGMLRLGCVLLLMLGGLLVWWGILALVGDTSAAAAAGWACLIVFALWLTNGTALAMLLVRLLLMEGWPADTAHGSRPSTVDSARPPEAATETPPAVATARPGTADLKPTEATGLAAAGEQTTVVRGDRRGESVAAEQSTLPHAGEDAASPESSRLERES